MRVHKLLVSMLLLLPEWNVCTHGEARLPSRELAASHETAATEEATPLNLFGTPSVGYVFEPEARALRPIRGIPGATVLGPGVDLGINVRRTWVSPRQDYVLAEVEGSPEMVLLDIERGAPATKDLSLIPPGADKIAVSPTGTAIAFYFLNDHRLQVLSGLPDAPAASVAVDLGFLDGRLS